MSVYLRIDCWLLRVSQLAMPIRSLLPVFGFGQVSGSANISRMLGDYIHGAVPPGHFTVYKNHGFFQHHPVLLVYLGPHDYVYVAELVL